MGGEGEKERRKEREVEGGVEESTESYDYCRLIIVLGTTAGTPASISSTSSTTALGLLPIVLCVLLMLF
jgi:hypothetical protein